MQVPKDPPLFLAVFASMCVFVTLAVWTLMPVYTPHLENDEGGAHASLDLEQALGNVESMLTAAEATLQEMEPGHETGRDGERKESSAHRKEANTPGPAPSSRHAVSSHEGHDGAGHHDPPKESSHNHEVGHDHDH